MNFDEIERDWQYDWYLERLKIAKSLGYDTVAECQIDLYRKTNSARKVGEVMGGLSANAIRQFLHRYKVPVNRRGGFRPGDKRWGKPR